MKVSRSPETCPALTYPDRTAIQSSMPAVIRKPSDRSSLLHSTAVNSILAEVRQLEIEGRDIVSLVRGEPDLPTPPHIVEAGVRALRDGRTTYSDNRGGLCYTP